MNAGKVHKRGEIWQDILLVHFFKVTVLFRNKPYRSLFREKSLSNSKLTYSVDLVVCIIYGNIYVKKDKFPKKTPKLLLCSNFISR